VVGGVLVASAIVGAIVWAQKSARSRPAAPTRVVDKHDPPPVVTPTPRPARVPMRRDAGVSRPGHPDPDTVFAVPVDAFTDPIDGKSDALVTIVEAAEFGCPFCRRVHDTMKQVKQIYGDDVRIVWKNFVVHPNLATHAAQAACAAHRQGQFLPYQDALWTAAWGPGTARNMAALEPTALDALAGTLGLDVAQFAQDRDSAACADDLRADQELMKRVGTNGTPSFYINGRHLSGAQPLDRFRALIDEELAIARKAVAAGIPQDQYYDSVVASGQTKFP